MLIGMALVSGVLTALVSILKSGIAGLIFSIPLSFVSALFFVGSALSFACILTFFRGWLQTNTSFEINLAFIIYAIFLQLPFLVISPLLGPLGGLFIFGFMTWAAWGYFKTFRVNTIRFIVLAIVLSLLFSLVLVVPIAMLAGRAV